MKTQNPLIGRSRKSYGDATFYTLNGENVVRTKPMVVANPNTPAQEAQRVRFKAFVNAANSLSEADLNLLFASKEVGRNRRSMLQAQLAPAYGAQATSTPGTKERFEPTFDIDKVGDIGSGAVGYIGGFVQATVSDNDVTLEATALATLKSNMQLKGDETQFILVAISEDGCVIDIATPKEMTQIDAAISEDTPVVFQGLNTMSEHGGVCNCYAIAGKLQLISLGTFAVAERPARKGHNPKHNVPV